MDDDVGGKSGSDELGPSDAGDRADAGCVCRRDSRTGRGPAVLGARRGAATRDVGRRAATGTG